MNTDDPAFMKPLLWLVAELKMIDNPELKELAIRFCTQKMIGFAVENGVKPLEKDQ